jgi:hypothetical protein
VVFNGHIGLESWLVVEWWSVLVEVVVDGGQIGD